MSRTAASIAAGVGAGVGAFGGAVLGMWPTANDWRRSQGFTVTRRDEERELNNVITVGFFGAILGALAGGAIGAGPSCEASKQPGVSGCCPMELRDPRFP